MLTLQATKVRQEWSSVCDDVVRDKPAMITRTRDRMWLSNLDVMQTIADARGVQLAEIAMNWSRQKPFVDTSIFGAQKRSRIESNAKCMDWELTAEEMLTLDEAIAKIL